MTGPAQGCARALRPMSAPPGPRNRPDAGPVPFRLTGSGSILASLDSPHTLIFGIGNIAREDDGLGWAVLDAIEDCGLCGCASLHRGYQLHLEDADLIAAYERLLFIDSTTDPGVEPFAWVEARPALDPSFTSHALSVPAVLATARLCFDARPEVGILAVRGYSFDLTIGLTPAAALNLAETMAYLSAPPEPADPPGPDRDSDLGSDPGSDLRPNPRAPQPDTHSIDRRPS